MVFSIRTAGKSQIIFGVFPSITWVSGGKRPVKTIVIISAEGDVRSDSISRIFLDESEMTGAFGEIGSFFKRESVPDLALLPVLKADMTGFLSSFCLSPATDPGGSALSAEASAADVGCDRAGGSKGGEIMVETAC
ncbi:MAG: hypothetical protein V1844_20495 [Pseudomonadota bacterium]